MAIAVIGLMPERGAAYCIAHQCDPDSAAGAACARDAQTGCPTEGPTLFRRDGCVYFAVQEGAAERSLGLTDQEFENAIQAAFDAWASVDCDGKGPPSILAQSTGAVSIARPFACPSSPKLNVGVWLVRDDLTMAVTSTSGATAGITHTSLVEETGEVYDSDVSLNELWFLIQDEGEVAAYLHVVAMHEAGHVLGLAHSRDEGALMYRDYRVSLDRKLTQDDIDGICALYPPEALQCRDPKRPDSAVDHTACVEAQRKAEDKEARPDSPMSAEQDGSAGCSVRAAPAGDSKLALVALVATLIGFARRRRTLRARVNARAGCAPPTI